MDESTWLLWQPLKIKCLRERGVRSLQGVGTPNDAHLPTDPAPDSHPEGVANPRIFLTPSEGVADPHIFSTPFEGVKSSRCLYRRCDVVLHLSFPLTPSEGVADPHIFPLLPKELPVPPSEGVQFCHVFSPPSEGAQMTLLVIGRLVSEASPAV